MAWTTPKTWSTGEVATAAMMNTYIRDNQSYLYSGKPRARVYHDANQSIANNSASNLAFNSERWDSDTMHDTSTNNSRLTCKTEGMYIITVNVRFAANGSGVRHVKIILNGTTQIAMDRKDATGSGTHIVELTTQYYLEVNDYVEVEVYQNSGGSLNVDADANESPEFMMSMI